MTRALRLTLLLTFAAAAACAGRGAGLDGPPVLHATRGADLSGLILERVDGGQLRLRDLRGKVVLLDLFATWCLPCVAAVPQLKALRQQYRPLGFEVVGISMDLEGVKVVEPFCTELGVDYPVLLSSQDFIDGNSPLGKITTLPTVFLVGRDGRVAEVLVGELPQARLEQAVLGLLD